MPDALFITVEEADQRVHQITRRLFEFLAEFNSTYPDPDAKAVASQFDYFTESYVTQTCASVLAEKLVVTSEKNRLEGLIEFNPREMLRFTKGDPATFERDKDEIEAG